MVNTSYDANSIEQLTFREGVRTRVGIYLGSADMTGVIAGLLELVNNATDESLVCSSAKKIELVIGKDWASCRDYGRGMPHGKNSFSEEVMINLLTENHSGAKFDENAYGGKSRGLNGTGSAATCCSSDWFDITSYRDGAAWRMLFIDGIPQTDTCIKLPQGNEQNGTFIKYKPSQEVFVSEPIVFEYEQICSIIKDYSYFNKGIIFEVKDAEKRTVRTYCSKNGLIDFAKDYITTPIHSTPIHLQSSEDNIDIEIILQWTQNKERFYLFSNGGENPGGGTPITGIKTAITTFMKKQLKDYDADMARTGLVYICSVNLKNPIYDGQTKTKITNPELRGLAQRLTNIALNDFKNNNSVEFQKIIDFLINERKADVAAERARKQVFDNEKEQTKIQKTKILNVDKLCDARKLGEDSILLLCEGLSAGGSMKIGRDADKYGILMLRGKCKNLLNCTIEEGLQNEEVKLFQQALGIIYGKKSTSMRYGKIAIASDSDFDGSHIGLLIMAMAQVICPSILTENRLYWLKAPIYKVETKSKIYFYYTEEEFAKHPQGIITKYKGLGQMNDIDLKKSMFNDEWQRLEPINFNDEGVKLLIDLMGDNVERRKEFVYNYIDFNKFNIE